MKFINKMGDTVSHSVGFLKEKNRQAAYINRLKAIIASEEEQLRQAYAALGKEYYRVLEGQEPNPSEAEEIVEIIHTSKLRLKKARARYEYTMTYGMPQSDEENASAASAAHEPSAEDEDITIAYADPDDKSADKNEH